MHKDRNFREKNRVYFSCSLESWKKLLWLAVFLYYPTFHMNVLLAAQTNLLKLCVESKILLPASTVYHSCMYTFIHCTLIYTQKMHIFHFLVTKDLKPFFSCFPCRASSVISVGFYKKGYRIHLALWIRCGFLGWSVSQIRQHQNQYTGPVQWGTNIQCTP